MDSEENIKEELDKNTKQILNVFQEIRCKLLQNSIAEIQNHPVPYPELTEEARRKEANKERNTWLYGYGVSFKDDREQKALQEGKLIF